MEKPKLVYRRKNRKSKSGDHLPSRACSRVESDFFNHLPNPLIQSIFSLLPLKDAARASVVCTRWRRLWASTPLCVDDSELHQQAPISASAEDAWCRQAVCGIISKHQGPIKSCRLSRFDHTLFHPAVDRLLQILRCRVIQELHLSFSSLNAPSGYLLPPSFLSCNTLLKLNLYFCGLPEFAFPSILPRIKEVFFRFVSLDERLLNFLLSGCPSLEKLHLLNCSGFQHILVSSPNLSELVVKDQPRLCGHIKEVMIENAPNLKHLVLSETATMSTVLKIQNAPKIKLLGFICLDLIMLEIGGGTFQSGSSDTVIWDASIVLPSVKELAVRVDLSNENQRLLMSSILKCCPSLEILAVKLVHHATTNESNMEALWENGGPLCFLTLRKVTLKGFSEDPAVVTFANFLISNARMLEEMTLLCSTVDFCYKENWVKERSRELCWKDRASQSLMIQFSEDWLSHPKFGSWNLVLD